MEQETKINKCINWAERNKGSATGGAVYGLGFIGAVIYYMHNATTFLAGLIGILKAFVWPAFVVYKLFEYFHF